MTYVSVRQIIPSLILTLVALGSVSLLGCEAANSIPGVGGDSTVKKNPDKATTETEVQDGDADMQLPEYHGVKHALAVQDFDNRGGYSGQVKLPRNLSIMMESGLMDTNRFVLVEREKLGGILAEQDLAASGRTAKAKTVARTGKLRPAKYIATGSLVQVEANESGQSGGVGFRGIRIGGNSNKAQITIIAKLVDSTTGEIVAKKRIVGKAGRGGVSLGLRRHGFSGKLNNFEKTPLGDAAQDCINQAARFFAVQMQKRPITGTVVMVNNGQVIINRGSRHNYKPGMSLQMRREGEEMVDPNTGQVLGKTKGKTIGRLTIANATEKVSYCDIDSGEENPEPGTVVQLTGDAAKQ